MGHVCAFSSGNTFSEPWWGFQGNRRPDPLLAAIQPGLFLRRFVGRFIALALANTAVRAVLSGLNAELLHSDGPALARGHLHAKSFGVGGEGGRASGRAALGAGGKVNRSHPSDPAPAAAGAMPGGAVAVVGSW